MPDPYLQTHFKNVPPPPHLNPLRKLDAPRYAPAARPGGFARLKLLFPGFGLACVLYGSYLVAEWAYKRYYVPHRRAVTDGADAGGAAAAH